MDLSSRFCICTRFQRQFILSFQNELRRRLFAFQVRFLFLCLNFILTQLFLFQRFLLFYFNFFLPYRVLFVLSNLFGLFFFWFQILTLLQQWFVQFRKSFLSLDKHKITIVLLLLTFLYQIRGFSFRVGSLSTWYFFSYQIFKIRGGCIHDIRSWQITIIIFLLCLTFVD